MKMITYRRLVMTFVIGMMMAGLAHAQDESSIIDKLGLTDVQKGQIKELRDKFRSETEKLRADIKRLLEDEKQLKQANPPNEVALRAKLKERADKEIEISLALTRFNERLENILTPEQKRLLDKIRQERKKNNN
jgi:Spy/CpxP family protein refolding chaperone